MSYVDQKLKTVRIKKLAKVFLVFFKICIQANWKIQTDQWENLYIKYIF